MNGPSTLTKSVYALPFPTHAEVLEFIQKLPEWCPDFFEKSDAIRFYAEMGVKQYNGMKSIFESQGDAKITREVGQMLYNTFQDKRQMWAVYYTYRHLVVYMTKACAIKLWHTWEISCAPNSHHQQIADTIYEIAKIPLLTNWDGIGDDEHGWRN